MAALASALQIGSEWKDIRQANCPLVIERRSLPFAPSVASQVLAYAALDLRIEGRPASLARLLVGVPQPIVRDATALAERFALFMNVARVRLRLERIDHNSCKKIHADYTDVRLICTYAGPGTDYVIDPDIECEIDRLQPGWIGLFKGHTFARGHYAAFHRSPPIEGSGQKRLLLVVDTPLKSRGMA